MPSRNDMSSITIWHNPRCSKSRQTLQLIRDRGIEPRDLMRKKEAPYKELSLGDERLTRAELVTAMVEHPALIERPIVFGAGRAVVGRPPENVLELLD